MNNSGRRKAALTMAVVLLSLALSSVTPPGVLADGTETLGPPAIAIASGTGIVAAGTGLDTQPGIINLNVPPGAVVQQVLLYWSGEFTGASDDTINVDGNGVSGSLIGGPTTFFSNVKFETFRADITALSLVSAGANSLTIDGLNFDVANSGAGILVIFDDGSDTANIEVRDGQDLAFVNFAPPLDTTVPQTFNFTAAGADRVADVVVFAGSVGGDNRPNQIDFTVDGVTSSLVNTLGSFDGDYWDTLSVQVNIPAGATMLTIQALSKSDGSANLPASLNWITAGLSVPPGEENGEGCTPGYWKNHRDAWVGLSPRDDFDTTFGVDFFDPDITLGKAVRLRGGKIKKVARHGTAALLNALHPAVDYPASAAEVIAAVQAQDVEALVAYNELSDSCPAEDYLLLWLRD
jgi:hypothetical protein